MKRALIFGASGQMGSYLNEFLRKKDYAVFCAVRPIQEEVAYGCWGCDLLDPKSIRRVIQETNPDEVYNLAAKMFAPASWEHPVEYMQVNATAVLEMLKTLHEVNPEARFFQAGSAEMFKKPCVRCFNELSIVRPDSPYGTSKAIAQEVVRLYRQYKGMFACTGIFCNAESPRRSEFFFASKVAKVVARIAAGSKERLQLGKLTAIRDWGLAEEYVEAAWLMLQAPKPKDYIIATGKSASCSSFVGEALAAAGLLPDVVDYEKVQPLDKHDAMYANPRRIKEDLGWEAKTAFPDVVKYLVEAEMTSGKSLVTG